MGLWLRMPIVMIQKVCEAVCLRRAFPQDLSGLYTGDEMAQSDEKPAYIKTHDNVEDLELAIDLCVNTNELVLSPFNSSANPVLFHPLGAIFPFNSDNLAI